MFVDEQALERYIRGTLIPRHLPHVAAPYHYSRVPGYSQPLPSADALAELIGQDNELRVVRLGLWLASPEGQIIERVVGSVLLPQYRAEYTLVVEALQSYAARRRGQAVRVGVGAVVTLAIGVYLQVQR